MANDDNLYGAPAQGLGQNVTFQFNTPNGTPQLPAAQATLSAARIIGGGIGGQTQGTGVKDPGPNPILGTIMRLTDGMAANQLRKKQTEMFFTGMQRAAHGEAVKAIAAEQPWYANLFGEADVVEGARAYEGSTRAQTVVAAMEDDMPNIRQLPPEEANAYFLKQLEGAQTGDMATDMAVMQSFTRSMPGLMRRQSKEHYGWQQERAVAAQTASFRASGDSLQAAASGYANGTRTEEEYAQEVDLFKMSIAPVQGQNEKTYTEMVADNIVAFASEGKLHAVTALNKAGVSSILTADQQKRVTAATEQGENKLRIRYSFEYTRELSDIMASASYSVEGATTADLKAKIDAVNDKYRKATGSTQGLISPAEEAGYLSRSVVNITRALDAQTEAGLRDAAKKAVLGDKEAAATQRLQAIQGAYANGSIIGAVTVPKGERDDVGFAMYHGLPTTQAKVEFLNKNPGYVIEPVKQMLEGTVEGTLAAGAYTTQFQQVFDGYKQMHATNPFTAMAYYGKYQKQLEGMVWAERNGIPPALAFGTMFVGPARRVAVGKKDAEESIRAITKDHSSFIGEVLGGQIPLKPGQAERGFTIMAPQIEEWAGYMMGNHKEAAVRAFRNAQLNDGVEVLGGYLWQNNKGQTSVVDYLTRVAKDDTGKPLATDNIGKLMEDTVAARHRAVTNDGPGGWYTMMFRLPDAGGAPVFHINTYKDGKSFNYTVSGKDLQEQAKKPKLNPEAVFNKATEERINELQQRPNFVGKPTR